MKAVDKFGIEEAWWIRLKTIRSIADQGRILEYC